MSEHDLVRNDARPAASPGLPRRLHLELTTRCNMECPTCIRTFRREPSRDLSVDEAARVVEGLPDLRSVACHLNGEPLLHAHLDEVFALLKRRGVWIELNTNGLALTRRRCKSLVQGGVDLVNISLDAASAPTYQRLRGVDAWERVLDGVRRLVATRARRTTPRLAFWMTATATNVSELPDLVRLAADLGVDEVYLQRLVFFGAGLARAAESLHGGLTSAEREAVLSAQATAQALGVTLRAAGGREPIDMLSRVPDAEGWRSCRRPWEGAVVRADGDVVPCCISTFVARRSATCMGNVLRESWDDVWNSDAYQTLRGQLHTDVGPPFCRGCGNWWSL